MHIYYSQTLTGTGVFEVEGKRTSCRSHHKNSSIPKPQSRFHPLLQGVSLYKGGCVFYQRSTFLAQERRKPLHVNSLQKEWEHWWATCAREFSYKYKRRDKNSLWKLPGGWKASDHLDHTNLCITDYKRKKKDWALLNNDTTFIISKSGTIWHKAGDNPGCLHLLNHWLHLGDW